MESVELQKYLPISIFEFSLLKTKYVDFKHAINEKSIYNARQPFVEACGDKRFSGTQIYDSGRYYQMFKAECSYNDEFSASDKGSCEIINKIFNDNLSYSQTTSIIRDYMKYKETYLHTM